jgi:hypothetical protein
MESHGMQIFDRWIDLQAHAMQLTGGKSLYSGQGIYHFTNGISILKSVDGTPYYDDNLSNPDTILYTLYGREGDQSLSEPKFNWKLLHETRTLYVFRVTSGTKKSWLWYGEYTIGCEPIQPKEHIDMNGVLRTIYLLTLHRK